MGAIRRRRLAEGLRSIIGAARYHFERSSVILGTSGRPLTLRDWLSALVVWIAAGVALLLGWRHLWRSCSDDRVVVVTGSRRLSFLVDGLAQAQALSRRDNSRPTVALLGGLANPAVVDFFSPSMLILGDWCKIRCQRAVLCALLAGRLVRFHHASEPWWESRNENGITDLANRYLADVARRNLSATTRTYRSESPVVFYFNEKGYRPEDRTVPHSPRLRSLATDYRRFTQAVVSLHERSIPVVRGNPIPQRHVPREWLGRIADHQRANSRGDDDLVLAASCRLAVSDADGGAWLAMLFGKPLLLLNDYDYAFPSAMTAIVPLRYKSQETGSTMTVSELLRDGVPVRAEEQRRRSIDVDRADSALIVAAIEECLAVTDSSKRTPTSLQRLADARIRAVARDSRRSSLTRQREVLRVADCFLRRYPEWLL